MARQATAGSLAPATAGLKRKGPSLGPLVACKRWRTTASGWASLPTDLIQLVACRVLAGDVVDYIAFRGACSGWRVCTPSPRDPTLRKYHFRPRGWVALCDGDGVRPDDAGEITFLHTRTSRCLRVSLPEIRRYRIAGFTDGLLILLHKRDTTVRVLHPFTRVVVDLPPLGPVYHEVVRNRNAMLEMRAAVCSALATSIAVVVWFPWTAPVVLCAVPFRSGWEVIHETMELGNTLPFQGRLYGFLRLSRKIVQVYPPSPTGPVVANVPDKFGNPFLCHCHYYLVESGSHMLLVFQHGNVKREGTEPWQRFAFAIFRVDISDRWRLFPVTSLCNQALFLLEDRCLSVSAKELPSVSSNSVYFSVPLPDHVIMHSLKDQSFERPTMFCQVHNMKERIRSSVRPFTICDHLLTYCSHLEW
ncbi:hypothetical protein HU200_025772 [Digitaria exilis]|uniref:KIB1-4 beta-propeller domain-containing protein n=1 Tax=Digitaria exilis TaxID=1010633 RepID=A0A835C006_9POAL|nr:hypothetical protein HU200_025772 [Digitaria exilis]